MTHARILGTGGYVPAQVITNADLERMVNTTDEWIQQRTGITQRHVMSEGVDTVDSMATEAARKAIEASAIDPKTLDLILVATASSERAFPSVACAVQHQLGLVATPAMDINAACSGFVYALSVADQYIRAQTARRVLVIGVDALTRLVDWEDRRTCVLFGDGAAALVLEASSQPGIIATQLFADGGHADSLYAGPPSDSVAGQSATIQMSGREVYRFAVSKLGDLMQSILDASGMSHDEVDWLVPHQANLRIIQAAAKRIGLPMSQVVTTVQHHANTSAASIPLALNAAITDGRIVRDQVLLLEAFGAGFTWGAALVRY